MPPHLLIVEDDTDSREMLAMLLESFGFEVATAARTKAATSALVHGGFDLVIADFMLESRDPAVSWQNIDVLVGLAKPSPIGLLTSWPVKTEQVRQHGLAFALPKPCSGEVLLQRVGSILDLPPLAPEQERTIRSYFAHLDTRDFSALVHETCTADVVYNLPSTGETIRGRDAYLAYLDAAFEGYTGVRFEIHDIRPLPRGAAIVGYTSTWREGERMKSLAGTNLFVFAGTRISEIGVRIDLARARELPS